MRGATMRHSDVVRRLMTTLSGTTGVVNRPPCALMLLRAAVEPHLEDVTRVPFERRHDGSSLSVKIDLVEIQERCALAYAEQVALPWSRQNRQQSGAAGASSAIGLLKHVEEGWPQIAANRFWDDVERDAIHAVDNRALVGQPHSFDDHDVVAGFETEAPTILVARCLDALRDELDARRKPGRLDHGRIAE